METLVDSPLRGADLMKACLAIEPDLNLALDLMIQITLERKFQETSKMTFRSLYEFDKYIQSLNLKDPDAFRERVLPTLRLQQPSGVHLHSRFQRWWKLGQWLKARLCCSSQDCQSTPPTEQK
jgi:hypothetical protein